MTYDRKGQLSGSGLKKDPTAGGRDEKLFRSSWAYSTVQTRAIVV